MQSRAASLSRSLFLMLALGAALSAVAFGYAGLALPTWVFWIAAFPAAVAWHAYDVLRWGRSHPGGVRARARDKAAVLSGGVAFLGFMMLADVVERPGGARAAALVLGLVCLLAGFAASGRGEAVARLRQGRRPRG
jgi:hypothetical protein